MVGLKPEVKTVSFSSYDFLCAFLCASKFLFSTLIAFLCASKFLFFAFIGDLNDFLFTG